MLPFVDDSTLFFATRMRELLNETSAQCSLIWFNDDAQLSERQIQLSLPEGPDVTCQSSELDNSAFLKPFDAIVTSRVFGALTRLIETKRWQADQHRPFVVTFMGGLDFTPVRAFDNRRHVDALFVVPQSGVDHYQRHAKQHGFRNQIVAFGHPTFLQPEGIEENTDDRRDVYFFAQALSPATLRSRKFIVAVLAAIARRHVDRNVYIKLRHLPEENKNHVHQEAFSYPSILDAWPEALPDNLKVTACSMDQAIERAGIGITCTSTAAIDLIRESVPTLISLDYVEKYHDPLAEPMEDLFRDSGLIAPLHDVLNLTPSVPNKKWLNSMLCPRDLGLELLRVIDALQEKRA